MPLRALASAKRKYAPDIPPLRIRIQRAPFSPRVSGFVCAFPRYTIVKLLIISQTTEIGGAERCILDLIHAVRTSRPAWAVTLLLPGAGPLSEELARSNVECIALPWPRGLESLGDGSFRWNEGRLGTLRALVGAGAATTPALARYAWRLRKTLAQVAPTIVHTHGVKAHLVGSLARPASARLVWHSHDYVSTRGVSRWLMRACNRGVDAVIANSEDVARDVSRVLKRRTHAILNGVDTDRFTPRVAPAADVMAIGSSATLRVGLVATYARWKGHRLFLEAAKAVVDAHPSRDVRFFIVGGGLYRTPNSQISREQLQVWTRELGLERHVCFLDFRPDIERVYSALDIVVHASTEPEPFGLVVAEAMACGRPVVSAGRGGVLELISSEISGLIVPSNDPRAMARALLALLDDPAKRRHLGEHARTRVEQHLSRDRYGAEVIALYERLLDNPQFQHLRFAA